MGRLYISNTEPGAALKAVKEGRVAGMSHSDGSQGKNGNLWPDAITDGKNYGWFEDGMLHFWGVNDEAPILEALRNAGFHYRYLG